MKPIHFREQDFKREVEKQPYSKQVRDEFFDYWSEPDRAQSPKMRFEKEKTWDLGRRLARWARNNGQGKHSDVKIEKKPSTDFEKVDELLGRYLSSPTSVSFEEFGVWYELMKTHKLLKTFSQEEIKALQRVYNNDNKKCRCAAVQKTFDAYANSGLRVMDIIRMREKLKV